MLLEQQSTLNILNWFLNDHVTLSAGVMAAENSGLKKNITWNKLYFKIYIWNKKYMF